MFYSFPSSPAKLCLFEDRKRQQKDSEALDALSLWLRGEEDHQGSPFFLGDREGEQGGVLSCPAPLSNQRELGPCTDLSCLQLAVGPSFWLALWALGAVPGLTALLRLGQTQLAHLYCLKPHLVLQVCDEGPRDFRHEMRGVNCPPATRLSHVLTVRRSQGCLLTGWGAGVLQDSSGSKTSLALSSQGKWVT